MVRILLGEPTAEIRLLLDLHLRRLGHEPVVVDGSGPVDPAAAAALLEPAAPELLELARRLHRQHVPLIFVSTEPPTAETRALAPSRHILKPFQRADLAQAVEAALDEGRNTPRSYPSSRRVPACAADHGRMARILIYAGDPTIESLLVVVAERMGHETDVLGAAPLPGPVRGDLLVVDPTAVRATTWVQELRRADPGLPIVSIGVDWRDSDSLGVQPTMVVPKPFGLDELRRAIDWSLRQG